MASLELMARGPPPHEDVLKIPTPAHQREAIAIIFIFPVISLFVVGARFYVRTVTRTRGLGMLAQRECSYVLRAKANWVFLDDYLMALALVGTFYKNFQRRLQLTWSTSFSLFCSHHPCSCVRLQPLSSIRNNY